jgi:hypothetical protein
MEPILYEVAGARPRYRMEFYFSIAVTWKDIPEISAKIARNESGLSY